MDNIGVLNVQYLQEGIKGKLIPGDNLSENILIRIRQFTMNIEPDCIFKLNGTIELSWTGVLTVLREFIPMQKTLGFKFSADPETSRKIAAFIKQIKEVNKSRNALALDISEEEINPLLRSKGFTERTLTDQQIRDASRLLALQNGANFSVPGAGKTTVTFAVHILTRNPETKLLVVAPNSAHQAWRDVVTECMGPNAPDNGAEEFITITDRDTITEKLNSGGSRFIISYDLLIRVSNIISNFMANNKVHLILDESHRMKAGLGSQRGTVLLNCSPLPIRRDILSGTPMPQGSSDLESQLDFLWPGIGLGQRIKTGEQPRDVLGNLYVRTTKRELKLKDPNRRFIPVPMSKGQLALYTILRDETRAQLTSFRQDQRIDVTRARKSIMRLLQVMTNPTLALDALVSDIPRDELPAIAQAIREEGPSQKIRQAASLARELANNNNRKTIIWTIFTNTILQLEALLADLNPVCLYGGVPSGNINDPNTREAGIDRFHKDPDCKVIIANPAAVSEGISLHKVCHEAIYVDRSYNATHYLQSIDRIHRLGLDPEEETNIYILQTLAPLGLGSIDHSVSRRLATKIRAMQQLLDDPDLHQIAFDEENADAPIDFDIRPADLDDLLLELEGGLTFNEEEDS
ncbi:DEAD/DEAH box helicase [Bacillus infantis]|uniref:SNF2-related protein n=1 Tax=Bacillus infantis TaxID=324767 RepID=UPI001CD7C019|nr:DEAD/DEAH box helicase [Bacillus infantis]MCA1040548.1 DEAD/DEAH box helicase [Bacillus infantis]